MMDEELDPRAEFDFRQARLKAFLNRIAAFFSGRPLRLLSYEEVREKLHIGGPIYRGVQQVPLEKIVGSLNRYHQFDRAFLPLDDSSAERWQRVAHAFYREISLPPIVLYKVGEVYFVVDGHHRVSVARQQGLKTIEAEVRECQTRVNITPEITPEDLEIIHEKVHFLERTNLDRLRPEAKIKLTIPDGFSRMLEHIAVHRYFMGIDFQRPISEEEAVTHWYDTVYLPVVQIIRESGILEEFPNRTEGDLYLWVMDHQRYLVETQNQPLRPPAEAAQTFLEKIEK